LAAYALSRMSGEASTTTAGVSLFALLLSSFALKPVAKMSLVRCALLVVDVMADGAQFISTRVSCADVLLERRCKLPFIHGQQRQMCAAVCYC